jgi:hypothetical protein
MISHRMPLCPPATRAFLSLRMTMPLELLDAFERGKRRMSVLDLSVIQRALEAADVEFIVQNGGGAGVRLRKAPRPLISDEAVLPDMPDTGDPYDGAPV